MITRYIALIFWPQSLVVDYGVPRLLTLRDVIGEAALIVALFAAAAFALRRWPAVGFLGVMFFMTLAPTSSIVPITSEVGAERRMYLPLAALAVLVVSSGRLSIGHASRSPGGHATVMGVAIAASVVAIATLAARNRLPQSGVRDTDLAVGERLARRPQGRARFALANELMGAGRHGEAITQFRAGGRGLSRRPCRSWDRAPAHRRLKEGVAVLEAFVQANPSAPNRAPAQPLIASGYRGLAELSLQQQQRFAQAADEARKSIQFDPQSADAHNVLGAALASQGQFDQAVRSFGRRCESTRSTTQQATTWRARRRSCSNASSAGLQACLTRT